MPGGWDIYGRYAADGFWMALRSAFPSADFKINHEIGREDSILPARRAIRWSLTGTHIDWEVFSAPSGARVDVMGVSHAELGPRSNHTAAAALSRIGHSPHTRLPLQNVSGIVR